MKSKEFLEGFIDAGDQQFQGETLEEFLRTKIRVRSGGKYIPYSFEGHAPLKWITRKLSRAKHIVFLKGAQFGISTWMFGRSLWLPRVVSRNAEGGFWNIVWFFPDKVSMSEFVQYKADQIIENSPYLANLMSRTDGVDSVRIKQIGKTMHAFRATSTMTGVKSLDSDINVEDEVDEHNMETLEFSRDRLLHSASPYLMSGSQPSIENYGIHAAFLESNQHWWLVRCPAGHWVNLVEAFMEDPESIFGTHPRSGEVHYMCPHPGCARKIDNQRGEYVKKLQEPEIDGLQMSHLHFNLIQPGKILDDYRKAKTQFKRKVFYISKIGMPYSTDDEKPITQALLDSMRGDHGLLTESATFTFMGADQGDTVHMLFGAPTPDHRIAIVGLAKMSVLDEELHCNQIERFHVFSGILDAMPNKNWAIRTALRYPDYIRIQYFQKKFAERTESVPGDEDGVQSVFVNRDESLQDTVDAIKAGMFVLPNKSRLHGADLALAEELDLHLKMLIRERGEDESGKPLYKFKKRVPNHFGMALNSLRLAVQLSAGSDSIGPLVG